MAALFALPLRFTPAAGTPAPLAGSVLNLANDVAGQTWRGGTSSYFIIDLGAKAVTYDTVALAATNLRPTDTIRIRTGTTTTGTGGLDQTVAAYAGDPVLGALAIVQIETRAERYMRIDISAPAHPDGYVSAARLIVAKALTTLGISPTSKHGWDDDSNRTRGAGFTSIDEYPTYMTWQLSTSMITDDDWLTKWTPFLRKAGNRRGILFVPETALPARWQSMALYGLIESSASGTGESFNSWRFEATLRSLFALAPDVE